MAVETNELVKLVEKTIQENTFNLEALEGIKAIKDRAALMQARIDQLEVDNERIKKEHDDTRKLAAKLQAENTDLRKAEKDVQDREKNMTSLEKQTAVSQAVSATYERVFDKVFANRVVRTSVQENSMTPFAPGHGQAFASSASGSVTRTTEEEHR